MWLSLHQPHIARNLSPQSTFDVVANGTIVSSVTSNSKGKLLVKKLATSLSLHEVKLVDAQGNTTADLQKLVPIGGEGGGTMFEADFPVAVKNLCGKLDQNR